MLREMSEVKFYTVPGSHPGVAVALMCDYKGIDYERVYLLPVLSKASLRLRGFPGITVPAARIGKAKVQGSVAIARALDERAEVIADFSKHVSATGKPADFNVVLETLRRRPCSLEDLSAGLGLSKEQLEPALTKLQALSKITTEEKNQKKYYKPL